MCDRASDDPLPCSSSRGPDLSQSLPSRVMLAKSERVRWMRGLNSCRQREDLNGHKREPLGGQEGEVDARVELLQAEGDDEVRWMECWERQEHGR